MAVDNGEKAAVDDDLGCIDPRCEAGCIHCGAGSDEWCYPGCDGPREAPSPAGTPEVEHLGYGFLAPPPSARFQSPAPSPLGDEKGGGS